MQDKTCCELCSRAQTHRSRRQTNSAVAVALQEQNRQLSSGKAQHRYSLPPIISTFEMDTVAVDVKWQKETFKGVEIDMSQPPVVFKNQLFSLTGALQMWLLLMGHLKAFNFGDAGTSVCDICSH